MKGGKELALGFWMHLVLNLHLPNIPAFWEEHICKATLPLQGAIPGSTLKPSEEGFEMGVQVVMGELEILWKVFSMFFWGY